MTDQTTSQSENQGPVAVLTAVEKTYHMDSISVPVSN